MLFQMKNFSSLKKVKSCLSFIDFTWSFTSKDTYKDNQTVSAADSATLIDEQILQKIKLLEES